MRFRISIRAVMALVVFIAVGTAALRSASPLWASAVFTATLGTLATGVLGAVFSRQGRTFWMGFALFGWGYGVLVFGPWFNDAVKPQLLTTNLIALGSPQKITTTSYNADDGTPWKTTFAINAKPVAGLGIAGSTKDFERIGHCLFAVLIGLVGGVVAKRFAGAVSQEARDD